MALELKTALYGALNTALACEVYDHVPQDAAFPYVTIGDITAVPFDDDLTTGFECAATIHTWSQYEGTTECLQIQAQIYGALHRQELTVSDYNFVASTFESSEVFLDADGQTRHGVSVFRIFIEGE